MMTELLPSSFKTVKELSVFLMYFPPSLSTREKVQLQFWAYNCIIIILLY